MGTIKNPYPEYLIDEASGIKVLDVRHQTWTEGYKAGRETKMIKIVIRSPNNMVMVFDEKGEQIPEYQGQYSEVKEKILKDAPLSAILTYLPDYDAKLEIIPKEEW